MFKNIPKPKLMNDTFSKNFTTEHRGFPAYYTMTLEQLEAMENDITNQMRNRPSKDRVYWELDQKLIRINDAIRYVRRKGPKKNYYHGIQEPI